MTMNEMEILGIVILEPISSLTDCITGIVGLFIAGLIWKKGYSEKSMKFFQRYFLFMGLATVCAGTIGHAFLHYLSFEWKMVGWSLSALGLYFFQRASLEFFKERMNQKFFTFLKWVILIELLVFYLLILIPETRSFKIVQFNATFNYIAIILPLYLYSIIKWKNYTSLLIIGAILWAVLTAFVYNTQISLHQWFNHHSLTHVLMTTFVIFMYFSVRKLHANK